MLLLKSMKTVGTILIWFLIIFLIFITISLYYINQQENDAILINIAGRQRMLSQKMTKELFLYILTGDRELPANIMTTRKLFAESLEVLINGGNVQQDLSGIKYDSTSSAEGEALEQLKKIEKIWVSFSRNFDKVLNNPENVQAFDYVKSNNTDLLKEIDQAVYLLQKNSEAKIHFMNKIQLITFLLGIIISIIFSIYFYNKKIEAKVRYYSFHDQLTGLYNRAFFEEELKRLDSERLLPVSIIMGDANGLKIVNDAFGHQVGDKFLKIIANTIKDTCREEDIITRWGGDEFVILLPETTKKEAKQIIERINNKFADMEAEPIKPSIAFGCATKTENEMNIREILKTAEDRMYKNKIVEGKSAKNSIISSLEKSLLEKNYKTEEDVEQMKKLALHFGNVLNLSDSELEELALLTALHDIGKIAIPDTILLKKGPLNSDEWEKIKKHPEIGYRIALCSDELIPIADYILAHNERWDGNGYPQGLKGEEIPLLARIIAIVKTYVVMTHDRVYKKATGKKEAIEELKRCAGTQFDAELVKLFVEKVLKL